MTGRAKLLAQNSGSAAVEMALVMPLLLGLMFGSFELGNYFLSEHVVDKAVRDAARYAARLPLVQTDGTVNYNCSTGVGTAADQQIRNVARTGDPSGTTARLRGWVDANTTVTLNCTTTGSFVNNGVYNGFPSSGGVSGAVPIITVKAAVPYTTFFKKIGLGTATLTLNAQSQSAVMGA
jgi:Flp pilus assembly protein TadG